MKFSKVKGVKIVVFKHPVTGATFAGIDPTKVLTDSYQRNLDKKHVDNIISNYNKKAIGVPDISVRGGKMYCVNGQHTLAVAIARKESIIFVWLSKMTKIEEARLFCWRNSGRSNKRMTPIVEFNASCLYGNPLDTMIHRVCNEMGFTTPIDVEGLRGKADIKSISMVRDAAAYKHGNEEQLIKLLSVLKIFKVKGVLDQPAKLNAFQRGLYDFMLLNPDITASEIKRAISAYGYSAGTITSIAAKEACNGRANLNHFRKVFQMLSDSFKVGRGRKAA